VVPARGLSAQHLHALGEVCRSVEIHTPTTWTVTAQRQVIRRLSDTLSQLSHRLGAAVAQVDEPSPLRARVTEVIGWCTVLEKALGADEVRAFEQFLFEVGGAARFAARVGELAGLPERISRQRAELARVEHLFRHPALASDCEALGPAPGLEQGDALDRWLKEARATYETHKAAYRRQHDAFWQRIAGHDLWAWTPPPVARSRHLGLRETLDRFVRQQAELRQARCSQLANLDFQSQCSCRFDGEDAPVSERLRSLLAERDRIETDVRAFFAQKKVKDRVESWAALSLESAPGLEAYLAEERAWPEVHDLRTFDEHLANVDIVCTVRGEDLLAYVGDRTWEPSALVGVLSEFVGKLVAPRIRVTAVPRADDEELATWAVEQALRTGVALPASVGSSRATGALAAAMRPAWVSEAALARLDRLHLPSACIVRALAMLLDGTVPLPATPSAELVEAVREVLFPSQPATPEELARLAASLYGCHGTLRSMPGADARWLRRLCDLAETGLPKDPPALTTVLAEHDDAAWLVLDACGLPLLPRLLPALEDLLPAWKVTEARFARVDPTTTTASFYRQLAGSAINHTLEKIDVIDKLLHERFLPLDGLADIALAELRNALAPIRPRFDRHSALLVLADHGFRLAPGGDAWQHGGPSCLERIVPVILLARR
jgi:hypothetical protein